MKRKSRYVLYCLIVLSIFVLLVSCNKTDLNKAPEDSASVNEESATDNLPEIVFPEKGSSGQIGSPLFAADDFPRDLQGLFDMADAVVLGTVVKDDVQYKSEGSGLEHALSDLRVDKVWKGDVKENDTITIHEIGWRYEDGRSFSIGGEPILQNGMKVVLFLGTQKEGERWIINSFQGKLFVDSRETVYSYEYYSDKYSFGFIDDVGETVPLTVFEEMLEGLEKK